MKHFFHIHQNNAFLSAILKRKKKKNNKKNPQSYSMITKQKYMHISTPAKGLKKKKKT